MTTATMRDLRLRWPATAALSWVAGWMAMSVAAQAGAGAPLAVLAGTGVSALPAVFGGATGVDTFWRRVIVVAGLPALLLATGLGQGVPGWVWAVPLALLLLAYPVSAWRDAPVFPTPRDALAALPAKLDLPAAPRVHDAGCGLGHGLDALRAAWPDAKVSGIERSWPWRLGASMRCPWAEVSQGDLWEASWSGFDLVYLFQRPESMARAMAKAEAEMRPGTWLVSLEFDVPGRSADVTVSARPHILNGRPVHAYRVKGTRAAKKGLKS